MNKEPKKGEFWVYIRGVDKNKLNTSDGIYEILDEVEVKTFKINERWYNNRLTGKNTIPYTFTNMKAWRIATEEDLRTSGITPPKQPELIEGQWYKYHEGGCSPVYLFKYKKHGKRIGTDGNYCNNGKIISESSYFSSDDNVKYISPANMEDVYKIFPEEKPKELGIEYLVSTKFYVIEWDNGNTYIVNGDKKNQSITLGLLKYSNSGLFINKTHWKSIREATSEEKQWLEACISLNKFIPKEEALKNLAIEAPKEGEYYTVFNYVYENKEAVMVGFVTLGNNGDNGKSDGSLRGKATFASEATKDFRTDSVWCYKDGEGRNYRLSTPEEIEWLKECIKLGKYIPKPEKPRKTKYEVGQQYKVIHQGDGSVAEKGSVIEIISTKFGMIQYKLISGKMGYSDSFGDISQFAGYIELIPSPMKQELSSLPDKWCIKPTNKEEAKIIGKWFDKHHSGKTSTFYESNALYYSNAYNPGNVYFGGSKGHGEEITFEQFKKWVLKEGEGQQKSETIMNTYGLKIGDEFKKEILRDWCAQGSNSCLKGEDWQRKISVFSVEYERKITGFLEYKGIVAFTLTNTNEDFYLRAEGFKESMDNFNKPKQSDELPEYVECIVGYSEFTPSKIYKLQDGRIPNNNGYLPLEKYVVGKKYYGYEFKPATKEQWDEQNRPKQESILFREISYIHLPNASDRKTASDFLESKGFKLTSIEFKWDQGLEYLHIYPAGNSSFQFLNNRASDYPEISKSDVGIYETTKQEEKTMFKKGDYVVTLKLGDISTDCAKPNYCFKQKEDKKGISPEKDLRNCTSNYNNALTYDKKGYLKDWRYATLEEIAEYDRLGRPYDVSTLKTKENLAGRWLKALVDHPQSIMTMKKGEFAKIKNEDFLDTVKGDSGYSYSKAKIGSVWELMPEGWTPEVEKPHYKFKIGDKVRAISASGGWGTVVKKGDEGVISQIGKNYLYKIAVDFPNQAGWVCNEEDLELVSEEKTESVLDTWLRETKEKNLSLQELSDLIGYCDFNKIYSKLEGSYSVGKAKILYEKWNGSDGCTPKFPSAKFQVGDEVQVCRKEEDVNSWGYLSSSERAEKVHAVAGNKGKIKKIKQFQGRWYYKLSCHIKDSSICEDCLTLINPYKEITLNGGIISEGHTGSTKTYTMGIDPYHKEVFPREKLEAQLVKLKQCKTINPDVNHVKSVETKLVKPKKVVLF